MSANASPVAELHHWMRTPQMQSQNRRFIDFNQQGDANGEMRYDGADCQSPFDADRLGRKYVLSPTPTILYDVGSGSALDVADDGPSYASCRFNEPHTVAQIQN